MNFPLYKIRFLYTGLRHEYDVYAFDIDVTYPNCLTMYFRDKARIVVGIDDVEELEITLINNDK